MPLEQDKVDFMSYHEELCGTSYGSFCLNGGICYMIPTVPSPFCRSVKLRCVFEYWTVAFSKLFLHFATLRIISGVYLFDGCNSTYL
uniref:Uncharacterized protein n=1 Tax=Pavo cristatus TaxID=9049 RepID=A0A8C9FWE1_PAVCR